MIELSKKVKQKVSRRIMEYIDNRAKEVFNDYPLGKSQRAKPGAYLKIWEEAKSKDYPLISDFEKENGKAIDEQWFQELALSTQVVIKDSDICYQHGRLLYTALSKYILEHADESCINVLETGTARGFSSLCMAKALSDHNKFGKILTFDVLPHEIDMYWNCIADDKGPTSRAGLLSDYQELIDRYLVFIQGDTKKQLEQIKMPRVHFAFLDASHTYEYVLQEFDYVKNRQKKGDMIMFDDYTPNFFPEVVQAIDEICSRYDYTKQVITISEQRGYVVACKK